jgi:pimeloyl-ACP methyl ester carboxylesterase
LRRNSAEFGLQRLHRAVRLARVREIRARDEPARHADDLAALLDYFGVKDVALVGLSLGGGAVINLAIGRPDRVRALVVVDPSLGGFSWSAEFTAELNNVRDVARRSLRLPGGRGP